MTLSVSEACLTSVHVHICTLHRLLEIAPSMQLDYTFTCSITAKHNFYYCLYRHCPYPHITTNSPLTISFVQTACLCVPGWCLRGWDKKKKGIMRFIRGTVSLQQPCKYVTGYC